MYLVLYFYIFEIYKVVPISLIPIKYHTDNFSFLPPFSDSEEFGYPSISITVVDQYPQMDLISTVTTAPRPLHGCFSHFSWALTSHTGLPQAPNSIDKSLPCYSPLCGTGTPYLSLSCAISPSQAGILSHLCGCLPHATRTLTSSSSRLPWVSSAFPLTLFALRYVLLGHHLHLTPTTLCRYIPTQELYSSWVVLLRKKERQEIRKGGKKLFMHFSSCEIRIDLFFYSLCPPLNWAHLLVYYQELEQSLDWNRHSKIIHWMIKWVSKWTMITWKPKFCSFLQNK